MKKIFSLVVLVIFLVGCENQDVKFLSQEIELAISEQDFRAEELLTILEMRAAENPIKGGPWWDRAISVNNKIDSLSNWCSQTDLKNEIILDRIHVFLVELIEADFQENHCLAESINSIKIYSSLSNQVAFHASIRFKLAMVKTQLLNYLSENTNVTFCGIVQFETTFTKVDTGGFELKVFNYNYPKDNVIYFDTPAIMRNGENVYPEFSFKQDSLIGTIYFNNLSRGKYEINGRMRYLLHGNRLQENYLYSDFEVK